VHSTPDVSMALRRLDAWVRVLLGMLVLLGPVLSIWAYGSVIRSGGDAWASGSWLINYSDGFLRRGLTGQALLSLNLSAPSTLWILFFLQAACMLWIAFVVFRALQRAAFSWPSLLVFLSPAALLFTINDSWGGFREELLVFTVLALLAHLQSGNFLAVKISAIVALYCIAVFTWEPAAFLSPILVWIMFIHAERGVFSQRQARLAGGALLLIAAIGFAVSAYAHGSPETASALCTDLTSRGFSANVVCAGGIAALGWTISYELSLVRSSFPAFYLYIPLLLAAVAPFILFPSIRRRPLPYIATFACVVPLFMVGSDYGRWIHIYVMSLLFIMIARRESPTARFTWRPLGIAIPFIALAFIFLWSVPGWFASPFPYSNTLQGLWALSVQRL